MAWTPPTDAVAASAGVVPWTPPSDAITAEPEAGGARGLSAFVPSIMRGGRGLVSLGGDVLPAMVGKAFGAEDYAKKQLEEAKTYGEETEKLYPAAVGSYKNVKDFGTGVTYAVEAVGEVIPSLLPSLFTGGAAAIAGRGAVAAAKMAAEKAAVAQAAKGATAEAVKDAAMKAGVAAANKVALKYQAVGAVTGSAAQNVPDVFQNIYEKTGKMDLGAAIPAGLFNAALDAVLPVTLLRKANIGGISPQEIGAAWYKRMGKGAATGFATEGGTEAVQEMSSAAAEKFVDNNLNFFTEKNFERFLDAGLKGGIGGGAITSVTDVAAGKGPDKGAKKPPPAPTGFVPPVDAVPTSPTPPTEKQQARQDAVAQRAQQLEEQSGITADDAVRIAEDDIAAEEAKIAGLTTNAPDTRVKARAVELIDKQGAEPKEAYATAVQQVQGEIESDVLAKEQGAQDVTGTKPGPSGKRPAVVSEPAAGAPAARPEAPAGVGVVPTGEDAGVPNVGEAAQPAAVAPAPVAPAPVAPAPVTPAPVTPAPVAPAPVAPAPVAPAPIEPTAEEKYQAQEARYQAEIKAEDEANAILDAKVAKAESVGRANAQDVFDMVDSEYGGDIDAAIDSYRNNTQDTLAETRTERGERPEEQAMLGNRADQAFDAEIKKLKAPAPAPTETKTNIETVADQAREDIKKPIGRPKLVLTPEQTASKAIERKATKAANERASRAVETQTTLLKRAVSSGNQTSRRTAYKELLRLLSLGTGSSTTRTAIRTALEDYRGRFTPAELATMKSEVADKKAQGLPSASSATYEADPKLGTVTNGAQAIAQVIKTGTPFQQMLAKRIRGFVNNVKIVVVEKGGPVPADLQSGRIAEQWANARGMYVTKKGTVYIRGASFGDSQGINNVAILHELLHAATYQKLKLGQLALKRGWSSNNAVTLATQDLQRTMDSAKKRFDELSAAGQLPEYIQELDKNANVFSNLDEFLAYGMSDDAMQTFLLGAKGYEGNENFFSRFVNSIRSFFGMEADSVNALSDLVLVTDKLLSARKSPTMRFIETADKAAVEQEELALPSWAGESKEEKTTRENTVRTQKEIDEAVAEAKFKFEKSAKGQKAAKGVSLLQMATDPSKVIPAMRDLWKRATSLQRNLLVKAPPTSFLVDFAGNDVPELKNTYKLMQQMGGMTEQLLNAASELTNEVQRAFQADPTLRGKLDELTSVATLAKVDPGKIDTAERSDVLDKAWKDLEPEGQRVYTRIRDHFDSLSKYLSKLLDDQVNSLSISAEAKTNLMKEIRATFEKGGRISPYFALVREGDFWLSMGSGDTRTFFMAETAAERDRVAREFAAERVKRKDGESEAAFEKRIDKTLDELYNDGANGGKNGFDRGDDISSLRKKPYSQGQSKMLTDVFDAIDSTNFTDPEAAGILKDAVYQTFLETMPDQSFRQQFIHREGVAGFRVDVLQNTAHISARMATQLARIKYSPLLRNSLSAAKDSIKGRPAFDSFVAEMADRVDSALAPREKSVASTVAGGLNKAAFIYYLSGASSALLQPLSIFQMGMPVLARYGVFKAGREMSRMLKVWSQFGAYKTNADGSKSWVAPSILYAKDTTPLERKAYRAAAELGLFSSTQASAVFEYKATPTEELKGPKEKFARGTVDALVLGGLMNSSERMSREAMFMTSFRLNMEQGKDFTRAVSQATYDTNEALGDYGEASRPLFMKAPLGKVLTQFMMYPLHVTMFLAKNFKEMIKPMDGRSRAEASYKFFGTLGSTYILAGATGLPMFSAVMGILGAAWEELKDDDWDESMRAMGFEEWFTTVWLHDQLGATEIGGVSLSDLLLRGPANAFTGIDIASRTSMDNLWIRESKEQKTIRESATAMALDKAGPAANMILSVADGVDAAMQGDYAKAVKKWAPAGFRNFVNAHELYTEGAKDNKGAQLMSEDKFTTGVLIAQTIGFRSDLLADTQSTAFRVIGAQQKIFNEQTRLLDNLDREFRNGNDVRYGKQLDKIADFNVRYPSFAISTDQIINSLETRMERRGTAYMGVVPTEKNFMLLDSLRHISQRVSEAPSKNTQP